jgi:hypothetical protein
MTAYKNVRDAKVDHLLLRLVEKSGIYTGVIFGDDGQKKLQIEGEDADDVWRRLHDEAGKANPRYFGYDGARARFRQFFPDGFQSSAFAEMERDYKVAAKSKLDREMPLSDVVSGSGFGEAALSVFRATNLLSPFEKTRLQEVLRGASADAFIRAAAQFTTGDVKNGLAEMERLLRPHDSAKWTVVTYLPFLWRPEKHMFLKPEVTKDFAVRVGHRFASDYEARLTVGVYKSLLDLVSEAEGELADLKPQDRIDIQSFIWTVGGYKEEIGEAG